MAVYLYNLIFSLTGSNASLGRFQPYNSTLPNPTILNQSAAWFTYQPAGTPNNLGDYFQALTQPLTSAQWGGAQDGGNSLPLSQGDYLVMRVATLDPNVQNYLARVTAVFARGTSAASPAGTSDLQSPLLLSTVATPSTLPRTVIDVDSSLASAWPPSLSDGSWASWLGMVHAASVANDYTLNVGASVFVTTGAPSVGSLFTFGHDPRMKVGGMMKKIAA